MMGEPKVEKNLLTTAKIDVISIAAPVVGLHDG
jgi:hypothetical protein